MLEELQQRVNQGIALLDEKRPGWADEIDLTTFDIIDRTSCVLAQLYGSYQQGIDMLNLYWPIIIDYGFSFNPCTDNIIELQTIWVSEITKRQQGSE